MLPAAYTARCWVGTQHVVGAAAATRTLASVGNAGYLIGAAATYNARCWIDAAGALQGVARKAWHAWWSGGRNPSSHFLTLLVLGNPADGLSKLLHTIFLK